MTPPRLFGDGRSASGAAASSSGREYFSPIPSIDLSCEESR